MATYRTDKVLRLEHFNRPNKTPEKAGKPTEKPIKTFLLFGQRYCVNSQDWVFVNHRPAYRPDVSPVIS
jgi:hypothetical protein